MWSWPQFWMSPFLQQINRGWVFTGSWRGAAGPMARAVYTSGFSAALQHGSYTRQQQRQRQQATAAAHLQPRPRRATVELTGDRGLHSLRQLRDASSPRSLTRLAAPFFLFIYLFLLLLINLVLINRRNGPRYQRGLAFFFYYYFFMF